jgi:hypothetical protein
MPRHSSALVSTFHSTVESMSGIAEAALFPLSTRLYKAWKRGKKPPVKTLPEPPKSKMQFILKLGASWGLSTSHPQTPLTGAYRATTGHPRACFQ